MAKNYHPYRVRCFNGEYLERYDCKNTLNGATKRVAQSVAKGLRNGGHKARVINSGGKWWVYCD